VRITSLVGWDAFDALSVGARLSYRANGRFDLSLFLTIPYHSRNQFELLVRNIK
jgi:hypothetical protein